MSYLRVVLNHLASSGARAYLAQGSWAQQHVVEGDFTFHRLWREEHGFRVCLHRHPVPRASSAPFWHPHLSPIEVEVLGPGGYVMEMAASEHDARFTVVDPRRYALPSGAWHSVRTTGMVVYSIMVVQLSGTRVPSWSVPMSDLAREAVCDVLQDAFRTSYEGGHAPCEVTACDDA